MKNKILFFIKNEKENIILFFISFFIIIIFIFLNNTSKSYFNEKDVFQEMIIKKQNERYKNILEEKKIEIKVLKNRGCSVVLVEDKICDLKKESCDNFEKIPKNILCKKWEVFHVKKPEVLKSLYYTNYSGNSKNKQTKLLEMVKKTEINSVVIDIKEVDGKVSFNMDNFDFGKIKPVSLNIFKNPKDLIKKLHEKGVYVIGRIVVFKDENLVKKRPDLSLKRLDTKKIWTDRSGKKYLDPNSKEVWDYTVNLSRAIYLTGFDEINFDYIRYPSDGDLNKIYFPFSQKEIDKDEKWGRAKVIDKFFNYLTSKLRSEFPEIQLSGDLFGYIAITDDDLKIGQLIESGVLYFDRVGPMTYPSHYNKHFLGLNSADSNPYAVIKATMKRISKKIDNLNEEIVLAKKENRKIFLRKNFPADIKTEDAKEISKDKVMIWLQGFNCTWCENYILYGKKQVQDQIRAAKEEGYNNWFIWNAASRYGDWFEKK